MDKLHRIEIIVADLEGYSVDTILTNIDNVLNTTAMNSVVIPIKAETKEFVWGDENPLNYRDISPEKAIQYFENLENDEYQVYLKLKEKYEK
ncbi:MAG: hypothetical protein EOL97_10000 [Spirochaetia bacterium]|nr:hypothetical protein [Spirochaetia bacterium]